MNIIQPLVSVLAPSIAAGIAAYLSIRLGLRRYAREKAFDARREWYEQATRVVVLYAETLRTISNAARKSPSPEWEHELSEELVRAAKEITAVLSLVYLYAKPLSIEAVELLFATNEKLIGASQGEAPVKLDLLEMSQAEEFARIVGLDFAREFRLHLGLEKLPVPPLPLTERRDSLTRSGNLI